MAGHWLKIGAASTAMGVGLLGVAAGIGAMGLHFAKTAGEFQAQMELIATQAGASQAEVVALTQKVLDLAPAVAIGPTELAKGLFHIESLGFRGAAAMDVLRIAAQGAQVGHADLEATVNALGGIMATHIKGVNGAADAMGQLNAIVGAGNMRMEDLVGAISTGIVPAAQTFGLTLKDIGGGLATLTDLGMGAEESATRIRMSIAMMGAPTGAATKELARIHLKALDLAIAMRGPGGLVAAIGLLKQHLESAGLSAAEQADVIARAFGGGRSSAAIMAWIQNFDRLKDKTAAVASGSGGLADAWQKTQDTLDFRMQQLSATWQTLSTKLGMALIPVVQRLVTTIQPVVLAIAGWISKHQDLIAKIAPFIVVGLGVAGTVLSMFGAFSMLLAPIAMIAGAGGFAAIGGALLAMLAPLGIAIGLFLAIPAAFVGLAIAIDGGRHKIRNFGDVLGLLKDDLVAVIQSQALANIIAAFAVGIPAAVKIAGAWLGAMVTALQGVGRMTGAVFTLIDDVLHKRWTKIWSDSADVVSAWQTSVDNSMIAFNNAVTSTQDTINAIPEEFASTAASLHNSLWEWGARLGGQLSDGVAAGIADHASKATDAAITMVNGVTAAAKSVAQVRSPSMLWARELGLPMAQGIGVGLMQGLPLVQRSAAMVVNPRSVVPSTSTTTDNRRTISVGPFYISGANDPKAVAEEVRRELVRQLAY